MPLEQLNVEIDSNLLDQVFDKAGRKAKKRLVVEEALKEWLVRRGIVYSPGLTPAAFSKAVETWEKPVPIQQVQGQMIATNPPKYVVEAKAPLLRPNGKL